MDCDGKESGIPLRAEIEEEPQRKNIGKYHTQYFCGRIYLLYHYGGFHAVAGEQHSAGQPPTHGQTVGQDSGGQYPYAGGPDDGHRGRLPDNRVLSKT